jgi:hypothetical protein
MTASLHIAGTGSSILDSVFVCRKPTARRHERGRWIEIPLAVRGECNTALKADVAAMKAAGLKVSQGDLRCLLAGHVARMAISMLLLGWNPAAPLTDRVEQARGCLEKIASVIDVESTVGTAGYAVARDASTTSSREELRV